MKRNIKSLLKYKYKRDGFWWNLQKSGVSLCCRRYDRRDWRGSVFTREGRKKKTLHKCDTISRMTSHVRLYKNQHLLRHSRNLVYEHLRVKPPTLTTTLFSFQTISVLGWSTRDTVTHFRRGTRPYFPISLYFSYRIIPGLYSLWESPKTDFEKKEWRSYFLTCFLIWLCHGTENMTLLRSYLIVSI